MISLSPVPFCQFPNWKSTHAVKGEPLKKRKNFRGPLVICKRICCSGSLIWIESQGCHLFKRNIFSFLCESLKAKAFFTWLCKITKCGANKKLLVLKWQPWAFKRYCTVGYLPNARKDLLLTTCEMDKNESAHMHSGSFSKGSPGVG